MWHLDAIDGTVDNKYNYFDFSSDEDSGVDIYILDSGVQTSHQEFNDLNVGNIDWGFVQAHINSAHGTHVAGTAAGKNVGIHKNVKNIYSYAVCRQGSFGCMSQDIEAGLAMVVTMLNKRPTKNRRAVINMSWGGPRSNGNYLGDYFEAMFNAGGIMVAAAGNSAEDACGHWPANNEFVIAVGAHNESNEVAYFSNYGDCVDIYAPGFDVLSSVTGCDYCYSYYSGTSMASPVVTGLVANLLSVNNGLSFLAIKSILANTDYSFELSECPSGTCRAIRLSCDEIAAFEDESAKITTTEAPSGGCSDDAESYECVEISNFPVSLGVDLNGVYTNTGDCYNDKPVYKGNVEDIGDMYLFQDYWWYVNHIYCKMYEDVLSDTCRAYVSGRATFEATEAGCSYYSYTDFTYTDDKYNSIYYKYASFEGSNDDSVCGSSSARLSSNSDSDDDSEVYGIEEESVSYSAVSENSDSTTDGSGGRGSDSSENNSEDEVSWWVWLLVVAFVLTLASLIFVVIYYQKRINRLKQSQSLTNYQLMEEAS